MEWGRIAQDWVTDVRASRNLASGLDDWSPDGRYLLYHDSPGVMAAVGSSIAGRIS